MGLLSEDRLQSKLIRDSGWLEVYGRPTSTAGQSESQAAVRGGEETSTTQAEVNESQTKPPSHQTEAALLSAMETAGKPVDDEDLREVMSAKGLGAPAVRATIIESLIQDGYINRENRELTATAGRISLITLLREFELDLLCSPELTGEWEYKLRQVERGELDRAAFMTELKQLTSEIVEKGAASEEASRGRERCRGRQLCDLKRELS